MKWIILFILSTITPVGVSAYVAVPVDEAVSYESQYREMPPSTDEVWYGTQMGSPATYQFSLDATTTAIFRIAAPVGTTTEAPDLAVIVVKDKIPRGVAEVARVQSRDMVWEHSQDSLSGLPLWQGDTLELVLEPGTYHLEISNAQNNAAYMVFVSGQGQASYNEQLRSVRQLQQWQGHSLLFMVRSPLVYVPLGILVLGVVGWLVWYRWRLRV